VAYCTVGRRCCRGASGGVHGVWAIPLETASQTLLDNDRRLLPQSTLLTGLPSAKPILSFIISNQMMLLSCTAAGIAEQFCGLALHISAAFSRMAALSV
jgi:hypothetical protein